MAHLGDSFPEHLRDEFAQLNIKPGTVIRYKVPDTNPPKIKFFILLGADTDNIMVATVFINSDINYNIHFNVYLQSLQYKLDVQRNTFLSKDSYVDCTRISERKIENLKKELVSNPEYVIGTIHCEDFNAIRNLVKSSKLIERNLFKKYRMYFY
jgi:hypothetical protein